jgi:hypothetical protein
MIKKLILKWFGFEVELQYLKDENARIYKRLAHLEQKIVKLNQDVIPCRQYLLDQSKRIDVL